MGLRRRLSRLLRARSRAAPAPPEDPIEALDLAYARELATAEAIRQGIAGVAAARSRLRREREALERQRPRLEEAARREVRRGRDDLAAAALTQAELLGGPLETIRAEEERLAADHEELEVAARRQQARLALLRGHREALRARSDADRARLRAVEALAGLDRRDTAARVLLERARERLLEAQARADALAELTRRVPLAGAPDLASRVTSPAVAAAVGRRLDELRTEGSLPPAPPAEPSADGGTGPPG
jgi:phage shock protein A